MKRSYYLQENRRGRARGGKGRARGRSELEPGIASVEVYETAEVMVEVRRRGRFDYTATLVHLRDPVRLTTIVAGIPREPFDTAKGRSTIHRKVEERHPGGRWSSRLLSSEVAEIRRAWGLLTDCP